MGLSVLERAEQEGKGGSRAGWGAAAVSPHPGASVPPRAQPQTPGTGRGCAGFVSSSSIAPISALHTPTAPFLKPFHCALQRAAPHGDAPGRKALVLGTARGGSAASCSPLLLPGALGRSKPRVPRPPSRSAAGPRAGNVRALRLAAFPGGFVSHGPSLSAHRGARRVPCSVLSVPKMVNCPFWCGSGCPQARLCACSQLSSRSPPASWGAQSKALGVQELLPLSQHPAPLPHPPPPAWGGVTVGPADGVCAGLSCSIPPSPCSERTEVAKTGFRSCWGGFLLGEGAVKHVCRGRQPQHTPLRAAAAGLCLISERSSAHTQQRKGRRLHHARPRAVGF